MKTIKYLTLIVLVIFSGMSLKAQDFKFGLVAGFDVANSRITNKPDSVSDSRAYYSMISFNVNGYIGFKSASFWGLSIEPGFIQKGGIIQYKDNRDKDVRVQSNYIQLPVLLDLNLTDKLFISIGPEFAYMINTKGKSKDLSVDITDLYDNEFEISGLIGINYNIIKNIDLGLRYNHGLTYIQEFTYTNALGETVGEGKVYNQYFQLLVRFKI